MLVEQYQFQNANDPITIGSFQAAQGIYVRNVGPAASGIAIETQAGILASADAGRTVRVVATGTVILRPATTNPPYTAFTPFGIWWFD